MPEVAEQQSNNDWYKLESKCIYCKKNDFCSGYGPRTLVICSCCNNLGTHVECLQKHTGNTLTQEFLDSGTDWFCSTVSAYFESHNGKRLPLRGESGEYSLEVVRHDSANREQQRGVGAWEYSLEVVRHDPANRGESASHLLSYT
ncbi:hypothetical protein OEZ85_011202 [Tetradesmus obliquus]|uniref:Zinc finger PHD-type domain-containing protein n=1 Tax=Tetradesmus obliquus TaxID=3088 RepID=A0ABY8TPK2_TETOB|nr:hypothetical protein OEZ85_011202 [Tetradesmus obliquus]